MNPFEYFQQMIPQIERDEAIMKNLRLYAFHERQSLTHLGSGIHNTHYRIGKIGDLWFATREYLELLPVSDFQYIQRMFAEAYINQLVQAHAKGKRVPIICGGVKAESTNLGIEKYFLLLEDLTAGGNAKFIPAPPKWFAGTIDGVVVIHDFDEEYVDPMSIKYMVDDKMILIRD